VQNLQNENGTFSFRFVQNTPVGITELAKYLHLTVAGQHNVQNAAAALAVAAILGLDVEFAAAQLANFAGSGRRFELAGEINGIILIDDYAHHPTEIAATLAAARSRYPLHRIWAVWQPHTYSRTRLLHTEFAQAFSQADEVVVTEIYASREKPENTSSAEVAQEVPGGKAHFAATLSEASHLLLNNLHPGDVVVVLSAGDADQINRQLLQQLSERTI
jgi:UDP-N-acetylmuramate--alanine ligase